MTSAGAGRAGRSTRIRTRARTRLILERRRGGCKVTKVLGLGRRKEVHPCHASSASTPILRDGAKSFNHREHREHRGTQGRFVVCSLTKSIYETSGGSVAADDRVGMVPHGRDGFRASRGTESPLPSHDKRSLRADSFG